MALSFPRGKTAEKIIGWALLAWIGLVFYRYFTLKAFLDFSFLPALFADLHWADAGKLGVNGAGWVKAVFCFAAAGLTLWRVGKTLGKGLPSFEGNAALRFCSEMALGILFFNGLWLGLGLNGLWFAALLGPVALAFFAFSLWDLRSTFFRFQRFPRWKGPGRWAGWVGAAGFLFVASSFLQALTPVVYYDALTYHLSTLRFWLDRHGVADFSTNLYSHYPFGGELYLFNGFFFQGGEAVKLLNTLAAVLLGLAAAGWVAEEKESSQGWVVWGMVMVSPWIFTIVWSAQNDLLAAFFLVLFFRAGWKWGGEKPAAGGAGWMGLWAGAALSVKYTAVMGIGAGILALGLARREVFEKRRLPGWGLFFLTLALSFLPWFLKNHAATGNGFYPYFSHWMGGESLPVRNLQQLMADHQAVDWGSESFWAWGKRVMGRDLDLTVGPLLFGFLPFLLLPARREPVTRYLLLLSGIFLLGGFLVSHQPRLLVPAFVVCFIAIGSALAELREGRAALRRWAGVVLLFGFWSLLAFWQKSVFFNNSGKIWLGAETASEYREHSGQTASYFDLTQATRSLLAPAERILIVGDARSLYYPRPFYANSVFDEPVLARLARREKSGEGVWRGLKRMGVEALVVSGAEGVRTSRQYGNYDLSSEEWARLDDLIQKRTDPLYLNGMNGIYRLRPGPVERKSPIPNLLSLLRTGRPGT